MLSTSENPQNFQAFNIAVPFFEVFGEGAFCFPVDLAAAGISGVSDGTNVTIQLEFNGGDDVLYQVRVVLLIIGPRTLMRCPNLSAPTSP